MFRATENECQANAKKKTIHFFHLQWKCVECVYRIHVQFRYSMYKQRNGFCMSNWVNQNYKACLEMKQNIKKKSIMMFYFTISHLTVSIFETFEMINAVHILFKIMTFTIKIYNSICSCLFADSVKTAILPFDIKFQIKIYVK